MSTATAPPPSAAAPTSAGAADPQWSWWAAGALGWAVYSVVPFLLYAATLLPGGEGIGWTVPVLLTTGLFWGAATPLVLAAARRLGPPRVGLVGALAAHLALALLLSAGAALVRLATLRVTGANLTVPFLTIFVLRLDFHLITYAALATIGRAVDAHRALLRHEQRMLALEGQVARARLGYLQQQLQPHFLFNALNGIAELTREAPPAAARMLRQLGDLLRTATALGGAAEVTLGEELGAVTPYLAVQRTRFADAFTVAVDVEPAAADALVPTLLLQPLVENAVRHGFAERGGTGEIAITARVLAGDDGARLLVRVADNGAGVAGATGGGIGLQNTRHRLAELYGARHRFALVTTPGVGSVAELEIPLRRRPDPAPASIPTPVPALEPAATTLDIELADGAPPRARERAADGGPAAAATAARPWRAAAAWAAVWGSAGLVWIAQSLLFQVAVLGEIESVRGSVAELAAAGVWLALTPLVLLLGRRIRITARRWALPALLHLVAGCAVASLHLAIVLSPFVFARPLFQSANVYPFMTDLCIYAALVAWTHADALAGWLRERGLAAVRAEAAIAEAEWRTAAVTLRPHFTLAVLEHAERLAASDPERAERTVELLADVLRTMLHSAAGDDATVRDELALVAECLRLHEEATGGRVRLRAELPEWVLDRRLPVGASGRVLAFLTRPGTTVGAAELRLAGSGDGAGDDRLRLQVRLAPAAAPAAAAPSPFDAPAARPTSAVLS